MSEARMLLRRASDTVHDVRARMPAVADAVNWRSPSTLTFRAAVEEWGRLLDRVSEQLARWDDELARAAAARDEEGPARHGHRCDEAHGAWHVFSEGRRP